MHEASVRKLTIGLENDDWGKLPIDIEALGGVSSVVMKRWAPEMEAVSSSPWLQRWHMRSRDDRDNALKLEQFAMLGNPFSENFAGDSAGMEAKSSLMRRLSFDDTRRTSLNVKGGGEKEEEVKEMLSEKEWQDLENVRAVTMTALNVFAKNVNQYVYTMELLPTASSTCGVCSLRSRISIHTVSIASVFENINPHCIYRQCVREYQSRIYLSSLSLFRILHSQ